MRENADPYDNLIQSDEYVAALGRMIRDYRADSQGVSHADGVTDHPSGNQHKLPDWDDYRFDADDNEWSRDAMGAE